MKKILYFTSLLQASGRVKIKDILMEMHRTKVDDMPFDKIVQLAKEIQQDPMAWPLHLEFKREREVFDLFKKIYF